MESLSFNLSSLSLIKNHRRLVSKSALPLSKRPQKRFSIALNATKSPDSHQNHLSRLQTTSLFINSCKIRFFIPKTSFILRNPLQNYLYNLKTHQNPLPNHPVMPKTPTHSLRISFRIQLSIPKTTFHLKIANTHLINSFKNHNFIQKTAFYLRNALVNHPFFALMAVPLPSFAIPAENAIETDQFSGKISIESIIISIDDFFNRNPFFVAGVTFIWLVVIPVTQEYLKKCKPVSAIDAFRRLRDEPNSQLLDIRTKQSVQYMVSPSLKILNKMTAHIEYSEGEEEAFLKLVLEKFRDPANTILCVLDNFDGNSMQAAQLLFDNGFKEVYAIKGGLRGKEGWQAIQETLLPPSMHVYPRKRKGKTSDRPEASTERANKENSENGQIPGCTVIDSNGNANPENGYIKPTETAPHAKLGTARPLSPYPNYPDLKPPSSPTPSKPQN